MGDQYKRPYSCYFCRNRTFTYVGVQRHWNTWRSAWQCKGCRAIIFKEQPVTTKKEKKAVRKRA